MNRAMRFGRSLLVAAVLVGLWGTVGPAAAAELDSLQVLRSGYPRVYFFRQCEAPAARNTPYEEWNACYGRLMGIEGKTLEEELANRLATIPYFNRFKAEHPDQLVLLHYNGNGRDPRFQTEKYFAGHWLYYNGAQIRRDVLAEEGESEIAVDRPEWFLVNIGRYQDRNDDVGLCLLDAQGRPDWRHSEQVQLISVDAKKQTIRVRRGCFGTRPMALPAGRAYAAAHVTEGPWGKISNLLWYYNYSTQCPRDAHGRTCGQVHADELAARFLPGGELAAYDGLEFDVLSHQHGGLHRGRGIDSDGDGQIDGGRIDGANQYGIGVVEFCRRLREKLGPQRLIMADGMNPNNQRAFHLLNGIESEGWPDLGDWEVRDWSGGLNRHDYWREHAAKPVFNYVNHKFVTRTDQPGVQKQPDVAFSIHRLVFAAAMFTDSAICFAYAPPKAKGELIGIWDEFQQGTQQRLGWLGMPRGPAQRLAFRQNNVLGSSVAAAAFRQRLEAPGVEIALDGEQLKLVATDPAADSIRVRLNQVPCQGSDLSVTLTARAETMKDYPREVPRLTWLGIAAARGNLVAAEAPQTGICLRGKPEAAFDAETGAMFRWSDRHTIAGQTKTGYQVHPPYKSRGPERIAGYTFWQRELEVPADARLSFFTGMAEKSPERSDGVWFRVQVAEVRDGQAGPFRQIFEHSQKAHEWVRHEVSLADRAGQRVRLKFHSDCGPKDNSTTDQSYWGDVQVRPAGDTAADTEPVRHMTFAGPEPFTSGFYFSEVRTKTVDLELVVEGREPVWISHWQAYQHADAMFREFDNGLVLANPGLRPYRFDLASLLPGQKFRRLQATPLQDLEANNGSAVGATVTLGPKEGLFLVRVP